MQLVDVFRARIVDVAPDSLIIEITGAEDKIDGLLEVLRPYGVSRWRAPAASRWRVGARPVATAAAATRVASRRAESSAVDVRQFRSES